jgi:hypothetical protein
MYWPEYLERFGPMKKLSLRPYERNHQPNKQANTNEKDIYKKQLLHMVWEKSALGFNLLTVAHRMMLPTPSKGLRSQTILQHMQVMVQYLIT